MGYGFKFCVSAAIWFFVRGSYVYMKGNKEYGKHLALRTEIWLAAAIVIGSLK